MKIYENLWKSIKIYEIYEINENLWKPMKTYENLWKSMKIYKNYENLWKSRNSILRGVLCPNNILWGVLYKKPIKIYENL